MIFSAVNKISTNGFLTHILSFSNLASQGISFLTFEMPSYVYCRFRNWYKSLFYRSYNLEIWESRPLLSSPINGMHFCSWDLQRQRNYQWKIECFLEDLFLGGQSSIILGYRRLSVKSLLVWDEGKTGRSQAGMKTENHWTSKEWGYYWCSSSFSLHPLSSVHILTAFLLSFHSLTRPVWKSVRRLMFDSQKL